MKITPGPWTYYPEYSAVCVVENHSLRPVADFGKCINHEANAKAIAAVPNLINALEAAHTSLRTFTGQDNWTTFDTDVRKLIEITLDLAGVPDR